MVAWTVLLSALAFAGGPSDRMILQFGSGGCPACQQLQPAVDQLVTDGWVVRYYDTDRDRSSADRWRVRQVPTLIVIERGKEVDRIVGANTYVALKQRLSGANRGASEPHPSQNPSRIDSTFASARTTQLSSAPNALDPHASQMGDRGPWDQGVQPAGHMVPLISEPGKRFERSPENHVDALALHRDRALSSEESDPIQATVRIRVDDGRSESVGTGTIIDTHGGEALILTCGHLFRDSRGQAPVTVEYFDRGQAIPIKGTVVDFRADEIDIGLISIKPNRPVAIAKLLPRNSRLKEKDLVFSMGCDHGANPSRRESRISKLNRFLGPSNVEVVGCPVQGRSGGGLFDTEGRLIGVCFAADEELNEGLYSGPDVVYAQLERLGLRRLYDAPASIETPPNLTLGQPDTRSNQGAFDPDGFPRVSPASAPASARQASLPETPFSERNVERREVIVTVREPGKADQVISLPHAPPHVMDWIQSNGVVRR